MNEVIGEILPLAVAVLVSPVPIAAEIILLFSGRPKPNAAGYALGFLLGVAAFLALMTVLGSATSLTDGGAEPTWAAWVRIALGMALLAGGVRRFRGRPPSGEAETPKWMDGLQSFTPARSFAVGLGIGALNPKNIVVGIAAAASIASGLEGESTSAFVIVIAAYALFASLGVLAPLVVALAMGKRADGTLEAWRAWLLDNNAAVMAVIFLVIGALLIGKGVAAL